MTPKEQMIRFYRHEYNCNGMPDAKGLALMMGSKGLWDNCPNIPGRDAGKDWFGVEWVRDGSMGVMIPDPRAKAILEDVSEWREKVVFPDLDAWDFAEAARMDGADKIDRENKLVYFSVPQGPFERLHDLMGFEEALMALLTDQEECEAFFDAFLEWRFKYLDKIKEHYNPDVIMYHDDMGTQIGMFMSPDLWREIFKPRLKKAVDKVHSLGMFFEYHSCGKIEPIIPDLVEIGVDAWQAQAINDIAALKKLTAGKLEYHPVLDYQNLIADFQGKEIDEAYIREYTRKQVEALVEGGHFLPFPYAAGDPVTAIMLDETLKLCEQYVCDPA